MYRKYIRFLWLISLLAASAIACNLFSQISGEIRGANDTAQALATDFDGDPSLLATLEAVMTRDGSELLSTARTIITAEGPQALDTAQAFITQEGPGLIETAQAIATKQGSELKGTVQAIATEQGPELVETAQALATQIAAETPQVPDDIPFLQGELNNLISLMGMISYNTTIPYDQVVAFYLTEMPANGWEVVSDGTYQIQSTGVFNYQKVDQKCTVTISHVNEHTYVLILIQKR